MDGERRQDSLAERDKMSERGSVSRDGRRKEKRGTRLTTKECTTRDIQFYKSPDISNKTSIAENRVTASFHQRRLFHDSASPTWKLRLEKFYGRTVILGSAPPAPEKEANY